MENDATKKTTDAAKTTAADEAAAVVTRAEYDKIAGRLGSTLQEVDSLKKSLTDLTAQKDAEKTAELAEQGKWKEIAEKAKAEADSLKSASERVKVYEADLDALLNAEAEGIDAEIVKPIVENKNVSYAERMAAVRKLKEKFAVPDRGGRSPGAGIAGNTNVKELTQQEFDALTPIERARIVRERAGK